MNCAANLTCVSLHVTLSFAKCQISQHRDVFSLYMIDKLKLTWYGRSQVGRRSRGKWHQQHHRRQGYPWSTSRTGCSCRRCARRSACTCPWKRSSRPEWGSNGWRWPCYHASRRAHPVPWGYARSNLPYLSYNKQNNTILTTNNSTRIYLQTSLIPSSCHLFLIKFVM